MIRNSYTKGMVMPREVLQDMIERCKVSVRTTPAPTQPCFLALCAEYDGSQNSAAPRMRRRTWCGKLGTWMLRDCGA